MSDTTDDLYSVTPQLTRARLATLDSLQQQGCKSGTRGSSPQPLEASFYSAPSSIGLAHAQAGVQQTHSATSVPPSSKTASTSGWASDFETGSVAEASRTPLSRTISPERENSPAHDVDLVEAGEITEAPPGTIVAADSSGVIVACGSGTISLLRGQVEGRKALEARELVAGRTIRTGTRLE